VETIVAVLTGVAAGAVITGFFNAFTERGRRKHDLAMRSAERDAGREDAIRARQMDTYQRAMTRLRSAHVALHRAVETIGADDLGVDHPWSTGGSADWAVDEVDQLRTVQADMDLFGSTEAAGAFAVALDSAETLRFELGMRSIDWTQGWSERQLSTFDTAFDQSMAQMRGDLRA
jgi:hypothetical protein